ncbi:MAG: hypothetical protein KKG47_07860 [Proteobacteria bacterium]|nr:hypothetical protein [Pseudomonadota bacterium]MBU1739383.1 hypothetical protein [Pseudomonadota bacterium]
MKNHAFWILIVFGILAANPASAWFWEKSEVKPPAAPAAIEKKEGKKEKEIREEKGFWAGVYDSSRQIARDLRHYFRGVGKEAKKSAKEVPGEAKKEAKEVGRSIKKSVKAVGQEAKEGSKAVGQGFKDFGHDLKDATKSVFTDQPKDTGK